MLAIIFQLIDGIVNISQRLMLAFLGETGSELRFPALDQFLQGADIQIAIMEVRLELRHGPGEEAPVLADGVPAHGRDAGRYMQFQKFDHLSFHFSFM